MDPCTPNSSSMPRIPGSFDDDDSDSGDNHEHNHGAFTQQIFIEGPGIRIHRTTGIPFPGFGSPQNRPGADGESGLGQNAQSAGTGEANMNIVEMLQTIFASIMGEQNIERVRQEAQNQRVPDAGGNPPGVAGRESQGDQRTQGNAPPMSMFGSPPVGSRFVYERHAVPPHRHSPAPPVEDISSYVPNSLQYLRLVPRG